MFNWVRKLFSRKPQGESYEDFLKRWNAKLDGSDFYEPVLGIYEPVCIPQPEDYPDTCPTCHEFCDCCACHEDIREDGHDPEWYKAMTDPNYYDAHQQMVDDMYAAADAYGYDDDGTLFGEIEDEDYV